MREWPAGGRVLKPGDRCPHARVRERSECQALISPEPEEPMRWRETRRVVLPRGSGRFAEAQKASRPLQVGSQAESLSLD